MFYPPYRIDVEELKDKISKDSGILIANDIIYCVDSVKHDFNLIREKAREFYNPNKITLLIAAYQKDATVLLTDIDINSLPNINDSELNYAIGNNQRIIPFSKFSEAIHSNFVIIDSNMYNNLNQMIKSKDQDNLMLACEIMSNSNRTDPESIKHLIKLSQEFDTSLISGISKQRLFELSPSIYELFNYLELKHYEEYKGS